MHPRVLRLLVLLALLALTACAATPPPTYREVQQQALVTGCWPDRPPYPTPPPVTVTPDPEAPPPAEGVATPPLPTTTPFPRCPPEPGREARPWPTPFPAPPPYPTMDARRWVGGSGQQVTLHLPTWILDIDLAVHPTEHWPVVGSVVWTGDSRAEHVMVAVYDPAARQWTPAHQVDLGPSSLGRYTRTVRVGVAGERTIVAAWGMSDGNLVTGDPPTQVWAATSDDYGRSWSAPTTIANHCRQVNDLATTLEGHVIVQVICIEGETAFPVLIVRTPDGQWQPPVRFNLPIWSFSAGTVSILPTTPPRVVSTLFAGLNGMMFAPVLYVLTADLDQATERDAWQIAQRTITAPVELGARMWNPRAEILDRPDPHGLGLTITFADADHGHAMAITSLDAGASWGPTELIMPAQGARRIPFVAPAYDPRADHTAAITVAPLGEGSTHFGSWSIPGTARWWPEPGPEPIPLVLGSRRAATTDVARARGSRMVWVAWVEHLAQLNVRSLDLNTIIPAEAYRDEG
jgi:hypothetical protein